MAIQPLLCNWSKMTRNPAQTRLSWLNSGSTTPSLSRMASAPETVSLSQRKPRAAWITNMAEVFWSKPPIIHRWNYPSSMLWNYSTASSTSIPSAWQGELMPTIISSLVQEESTDSFSRTSHGANGSDMQATSSNGFLGYDMGLQPQPHSKSGTS